MKKTFKVILVLIVSLLLSSCVFASSVESDTAILSLVKDETCDIKFGTYGEFEKKLVNIDKDNKTVDISLRVKNNDDGNHTGTQTITTDVAGEVVLMIDVSHSMVANTINGITRKQIVTSAADTLVDKLFEANRDIKVGVVKFSTVPEAQNGSDEDAKVVTSLSNDKTAVKGAISDISSATDMGDLTDIEAGLKASESLLSSDESTKKYIVVLTDGLPNTITSGPMAEYSDTTLNATKAALDRINGKGINLVSLLIGVTDDCYDYPTIFPQNYSSTDSMTYQQLAETLFGTSTLPKYKSVYYASSTASANSVTQIITTSIFKDLVPQESTVVVDESEKYKLTDISIKDYFPQYIVDNFTFSIVTPPSIGEITTQIADDRSITWTIPELKAGEESSLVYRLTVNETIDSDILDKALDTNENVTIDYKEGNEPKDPVSNDKTPAVKLEIPVKGKDDPTVSPTPIPKTGSYTWILIGMVTVLGISAATYGIIKSKKIK